MRRAAREAGASLIEFQPIESFEQIRQATRRMGQAVGEPARAEALVRRMDATLAALKATAPATPVRVVAWGAGGSVPGKGTLTNQIIEAAGAINIGATLPNNRYGRYGL